MPPAVSIMMLPSRQPVSACTNWLNRAMKKMASWGFKKATIKPSNAP